MSKRVALMTCMVAMSMYMTYVVITTSLKSNLFTEWSTLAQIPWMTATVKDFYQNLFILCLWVLYKEGRVRGMLWSVCFVFLGSVVTPLYVLKELWALKPGEPLSRILVRRA